MTGSKLAPYVPRWLLRQIASSPRAIVPGQVHTLDAAVLVLDVVDFTTLTESMATLGPRHIESLRQILDTIFSELAGMIYAFGGDVLRFGGDAIVCMWPADQAQETDHASAVLLACAAALNVQSLMARFSHVDTPDGPIAIQIRVGIGYGAATIIVVGDADQRQLALTGPALDDAIQAEVAAQPGQVRLYPSIMRLEGNSLAADVNGVLHHLNVLVRPFAYSLPFVDDEQIAPFVHPVLARRELAGMEGFVTEFRSVVPMFIELERRSGDDIATSLNAWVGAIQTIVNDFGGWLSCVEAGDNGNVLLVEFGAPVAHENDEQRAVACALALRETMTTLFPTVQLRMGITRGRLFAGTLGTADWRVYTLVGDEMNLAARLMEMAPPGQIIVSARVRNVTERYFTFRSLGSVHVRGKNEAVPMFAVLETRRTDEELIGQYLDLQRVCVGREQELDVAEAVMARVWAGQGQVLAISGEAGIGKSHLVAELIRRWVARGGVAVGGDCFSFARQTPYLPWRWITAACCGLMGEMDKGAQLEKLAEALAQLPTQDAPDYWTIRLPLLAEVLGLDVPDNELTRGLQEQFRRDNTFVTVQALLRARASQAPTLVLIEDAHWADDLSLQLAAQVASELSSDCLLFILVHRPLPLLVPALWSGIQQLPHYAAIVLSELDREATCLLVQKHLGDVAVPDELADMVYRRTQGHPFFTEEIMHMFQAMGCLARVNGGVTFDSMRAAEIHFPDTIEGVIQARVDQLDEEKRLTLKVASVIGRLFPFCVLAGVYPVRVTLPELEDHLDALERLGLTLLEQLAPELEYIFKHSITQEVVYESMAFAQRKRLHEAVAHWYERQYGGNLEPYYSLMAYHYGRAEQGERELYYVLLAASYAMRIYAIAEAISHYERALELIGRQQQPAQAASILMRLARAVHVIGQYDRARGYCQQALALYEQVGDFANMAEACFETASRLDVHDIDQALEYALRGLDYVRDHPEAHIQMIKGYSLLGVYYRTQGNYEAAWEAMSSALAMANEVNDYDGLWRCYRTLSIHHHSQGQKREALEAGALAAKYTEEANAPIEHRIISLNNLACFAQGTGDLDEAIKAGEAGLALARRAGIISEQVILASTIAEIHNHRGDWDAAERVVNEGLRLLAQRPHPYHEVALHIEAGRTAYGRGDWQAAIRYLAWAEEKSHTGTQQMFTAETRAELAAAWLQQGDIEQAERWAALACGLAEQRNQRGALAVALCVQGMIERERGNWQTGKAAFERALALARELNDPVELARTLLEYGLLLIAQGWTEEGGALLRQAKEQADTVQLVPVAQAASQALLDHV